MGEIIESVKVDWIGHATVKLEDSDGKIVYIDPWSDVVETGMDKADIIISTHNHFDHFDKKAIQSLKKRGTVLICTENSVSEVPEDLSYKEIKPGTSVKAKGVVVKGVHAYNIDKFRENDTLYHPKGFATGVIFRLDGVKFYHASDTDPIQELDRLWEQNIDVVFLPIGGTFTMDQEEAITAINMIRPEKVVPIHYGYVDETTADIDKFIKDVTEKTEAEPLILE